MGVEQLVTSFNSAFNEKNLKLLEDLMSENFLHESGSPGPLGLVLRGKTEPLQRWKELFENLPNLYFTTESKFSCGNKCVVLWTMTYEDEEGIKRKRGIDLFKALDGKLIEKLTYVKGV
ncbi:MAG: nuclear transport factor 2 family protein [Taibaiella sp.]|nr:nuclear transport factor 2 family protein [Taibaiella sp.]